MMAYLLVKHTVEDFSKWKVGFDDHEAIRKENGSKGGNAFPHLRRP